MSDSEQQDILDGLIHIYECDEQQVSALIVPTDGEIRENLPVSIEDADSDTVYTTTTTDANGMINTTFSLSPGTHTPIVKCGNDTHNIYDAGVVCHACSLTLTSDKDILSAADNDVATLTATLMGTESRCDGPLSDREITFEIYKASDDTLIETQTATTNSNGQCTVSFLGKGAGDLYIKSLCGLVSKTYEVKDAYLYIGGNVPKGTQLNLNGVTTFKATFSTSQTSTYSNGTYLRLGEDSSNTYNFGRAGDRIIYTPPFTQETVSSPTDITVTYDGTKFTISSKGVSLTKNATLTSTWNYWYANIEPNGNMSNLLIMPL